MDRGGPHRNVGTESHNLELIRVLPKSKQRELGRWLSGLMLYKHKDLSSNLHHEG